MSLPADVSLRPALAADAACLSRLATDVFLATYAAPGNLPALRRQAEAEFSRAAFARRLREPGTLITIAERSGDPLALSELVLGAGHPLVAADRAAELTRLYVQSPFLRQGVGRRLLAQAEALAAARGASVLWLTAWVGNERALAFYASQGYRQMGSTGYSLDGATVENRLFAKTLQAPG